MENRGEEEERQETEAEGEAKEGLMGAPGNLCRVNNLCTAYAGVIGADARPRNAARPARGLTPLATARRRRGLKAAAKRPSLRGDFQGSATFARRSRAVRTYGPRRTPAARKPPCGGTRNAYFAGCTKTICRQLDNIALRRLGRHPSGAVGFGSYSTYFL